MVIRVISAGLVSAAFCGLFQVAGGNVIAAGINGALGYLIYLLFPGEGNLAGLLLSSMFMAVYAEAAARVRKAPAILFLSAALIPIVPGGGMFECALKILRGQRLEAVAQFGNVMLEAGAIALGIILVSSAMQMLQIRKKNIKGVD